jgi:hypothetical protein
MGPETVVVTAATVLDQVVDGLAGEVG